MPAQPRSLGSSSLGPKSAVTGPRDSASDTQQGELWREGQTEGPGSAPPDAPAALQQTALGSRPPGLKASSASR